MSTDLIRLTSSKSALSPVQALILAEEQDEATAYELQPARVKVAPGGIGQFMLGADETKKSFTAIVPISQIVRGYWAQSGTGSAPLCSSGDGVYGFFAAEPSNADFDAAALAPYPHPAIQLLRRGDPLPTSYSCAACPLNQWGSEYQKKGKGGRGKACKEMRRLLLLIEDWSLPAVFAMPPTSIGGWDTYCSGLRAKRGAYFGVRTKFELDTAKASGGETYNTVKVSALGDPLTVEEMEMVINLRKHYAELVRQAPVQNDEYMTVQDADADSDVAPL